MSIKAEDANRIDRRPTEFRDGHFYCPGDKGCVSLMKLA